MINIPIQICIFSSREKFIVLKNTLLNTISEVEKKIKNFKIIVLINGNAPLYSQIKEHFKSSYLLEIYNIDVADKGAAWNHHIHNLAIENTDCFYLDGYTLINSMTIPLMLKTLQMNVVLGTSGTPPLPWLISNKFVKLKKKNHTYGYHGNCCAISHKAISEIKRRKIFIPNGMYRVDGFIGGLLSFGLDQTNNDWEPNTYCPNTTFANWTVQRSRFNIINEIKIRYKRKLNQVKGEFENKAISFHLLQLKTKYEELPKHISEIIDIWKCKDPIGFKDLSARTKMHKRISLSFDSR